MRWLILALFASSAAALTEPHSLVTSLDSLDLADGEYRTAIYMGSGKTLQRSVQRRNEAHRALNAATPSQLRKLAWPDRLRFMERGLYEGKPDWSSAAAQAYGRELPPSNSPNRGRAALLLGLSHLERDPDSLRTIDPDTRLKFLREGSTPGREDALRILEAGTDAVWLLQDEVIYRAYQVSLALGDTERAASWAERLREMKSPRMGLARGTIAKHLLRNGNWQEAVDFLRTSPLADETPEILELRAQGLISLQQYEKAAVVLEKLVGKYPKSSHAPGAYESRLALKMIVPLPPGQQAYLLVRLQEGVPEAGDSLLAVARNFTNTQERNELVFQVARYAYKTKQYDRAESLLVPMMEQVNPWPSQDQARLTLARTYRNSQQLESMRYQYRILIDTSVRQMETAIWELGREAYSQGSWVEAEAVFTELLQSHPTQTRIDGALMYRGYARYRLGRVEEALSDFRELARTTRTAWREEQAAYWRGRMLDNLGQGARADTVRLAAIVRDIPESYYGVLLRDATGFNPWDMTSSPPPLDSADTFGVLLDDLPFGSSAERRFRRGIEYARMGMASEASKEFKRSRSREKPPPLAVEQVLALATATYHVYPLGVSQALRVLPRLAADALERSAYERLALPPAFAAAVMQLGDQTRLNPAVIWSVMREESLYDSFAVSRAGALGLLQLMPETLLRITRETGMDPRPVDHLFLPRINLTLGTLFYRDRLDDFGGEVLPALASYNAGEDKAFEWLELAGGQTGPDFIECIGYPETADYVRRIGRMMWLYPLYYQLSMER